MNILAYDLGASSGRAVLGLLSDSRIHIKEIHRFSNDPVMAGEHLHWDILRLLHELKQGMLKVKLQGEKITSIGIDSWAVDYGLLNQNGELLGNPYHYRDKRTDGVMEEVTAKIPAEHIFRKTGIQFLPFNTIYQLAALKRQNSYMLKEAAHFLMIPDLLRFFLTGEKFNEFTNATTTQLFNPRTGDWDTELLYRIGVPEEWFGKVLTPGSDAGELRPSIMQELGIPSVRFVAVAEHDTGSAVAAVPATTRSFAYLSCGTWSLMGTEVEAPVINETSQQLNFTNEGGANHTYRLLKNIMGLWIFQETLREFKRAGKAYSYDEILTLAQEAKPFQHFIDPDDPSFLPAGTMTDRLEDYLIRTGQGLPQSDGEIVRCILESLALKYRHVLDMTEQVSGQQFDGLHMVGGGINNKLLCAWTASAIGKPVYAGPVEASAIGNLVVQWMNQGIFKSAAEARAVIRDSFPVLTYEPEHAEAWREAYSSFAKYTGLAAYA
ncbi:rhamnulokinase [Paenibacillus urinalis]|uniref:Rhamnulokinase n=1 Tax=Paenibacillus urinalis TaxID=521520 RepID=A0ABY7XFK8_9BACL|nr:MULTISPECIES: rhamnulokinase family protein [Paenibacillus]WDH96142.1 rhamnulokinase [Paenibacillus urinalis]WDI04363.1 rhamnulokinase [Paenibacillus urinalis]GAK38301.1 carbohydrate kinase [Paenibacillus sp. TCA20]